MTIWREKLQLNDGESLKHSGSRTKGFMQETDIESFDILDKSGTKVGYVVLEDHTAVKGFKRTISLSQKNAEGRVIVNESWTV